MIFNLPAKYIAPLKDFVQTMSVELKDGKVVTLDRSIIPFNALDVDRDAEPFCNFPDEWFSEPVVPRPDMAKVVMEMENQISSRMAMRVKTPKKEFIFVRVPQDGNVCNVGTSTDDKEGYIVEVGDSNAVGRNNFAALAHRLNTHWFIESVDIIDTFQLKTFEIVEKYCSFVADWYSTDNSGGSANISTFMNYDEVRCQKEKYPHLEYRAIGLTSIRLRKDF
jgi:hypothetical protein